MSRIPGPGIRLLTEERIRQITEEGYSNEHDAAHTSGDLVYAARAYAAVYDWSKKITKNQHTADQVGWPWGIEYWKPTDDPIRNLVKAGALIAAEIDRLVEKKEAT